jgi:hypothetical protein
MLAELRRQRQQECLERREEYGYGSASESSNDGEKHTPRTKVLQVQLFHFISRSARRGNEFPQARVKLACYHSPTSRELTEVEYESPEWEWAMVEMTGTLTSRKWLNQQLEAYIDELGSERRLTKSLTCPLRTWARLRGSIINGNVRFKRRLTVSKRLTQVYVCCLSTCCCAITPDCFQALKKDANWWKANTWNTSRNPSKVNGVWKRPGGGHR